MEANSPSSDPGSSDQTDRRPAVTNKPALASSLIAESVAMKEYEVSIFVDFADAFEEYVANEVRLTITNVAVETGDNDAVIDTREVWKFKVKVKNTGYVNMKQIEMHILGRNNVLVSEASTGPWVDFLTTTGLSLTVDAESTRKTGYLYFLAPAKPEPAGSRLLEAHIDDWEGDLDHILTRFTNHSPVPSATYDNEVA